MIETIAERRAKRLRPRDWARLDRDLRAYPVHANWPTDISAAHREQRRRRRPGLERICCDGCGAELGEVRPGAQVWCRRCSAWSGAATERGKV